VRLAVKPYLGLEVVIPRRFPRKQIPRILQQHEVWIIKQLEKLQQSLQPVRLPCSIQLTLSDETYPIEYAESARSALREQAEGLIIQHDSGQQAITLLRRWIRRKAQALLTPQLEGIAEEFGFQFKKTSVRSQKSRWGSCSSSGTISLNDQLVFMPATTVRYLMIHELCHTRHMNHSRAYWQLVESCCADFKTHEKVLAQGRQRVPEWFLKDLLER
jgi:hypothetical protein